MRLPLGGLGAGLHVVSEQGRHRRAPALEGDMGPFDFFFQARRSMTRCWGVPGPAVLYRIFPGLALA